MTKAIATEDLYLRIAGLLQAAKQNVVRAVNQTMVYTYFEIGRMIIEEEQHGKERAEYGKQVLKELSIKLTADFGKGFSEDNLGRMKNFYLIYAESISAKLLRISKDSISSTPLTKLETSENQSSMSALEKELEPNTDELIISDLNPRRFCLSWSHYLRLMRIENLSERSFYEIECINNSWTLKEFQRQFDSALYERLALSRDKEGVKQLAKNGQFLKKPIDLLKDPYILEFLDLPEQIRYSENDLEAAIIEKLEHFLLELGNGFTFAGRQVRITIEEEHFKVDLVFYNRLLKCFVVIDLKIGKLSHQDIGQMQMYVNYYDRFIRLADENKTIGIILCKDKSQTLVEITLPENNDQIFASRYRTVLPDKKTFVKLLNQSEG